MISILSFVFHIAINAQGSPPPPLGGGASENQNVQGGSAPIGGSPFILLGLGAAYRAKKVYYVKNETLED